MRVKYRAEYALGLDLGPGDFAVAREGGRLVITVGRPRQVAPPSVRLLGYEVLESGLLVDEKAAVIELQQLIQAEAERRGRALATRSAVARRSERALLRLLSNLLAGAAEPDVQAPPPLMVRFK